ncbi:MAG: hypothetical protein ACR5K7_02820 [Symbiopectobacterium sp.]
MAKGSTDLHTLQQVLNKPCTGRSEKNMRRWRRLLLAQHGNKIPKLGEVIELHHFRFEIIAVLEYCIELVQSTCLANLYVDE